MALERDRSYLRNLKMERKNIIFALTLISASAILLVLFAILIHQYSFATENKTRPNTPTTTSTNLQNRTVQLYAMKDKYGQNYLRFDLINSELGMFTYRHSPAMVCQESGFYNFTLYVVYNEENCREVNSHIDNGVVHIEVMKSEDNTIVKDHTEKFWSRPGNTWMVHATLDFHTKCRQGLLINSTFIDCISWNESYLNVTKVSL